MARNLSDFHFQLTSSVLWYRFQGVLLKLQVATFDRFNSNRNRNTEGVKNISNSYRET